MLFSIESNAQSAFYSLSKAKSSKPPLDSSAYRKWAWVSNAKISNNGNYVFYTINNKPIGSKTTVLQATTDEWKLELPGIENVSFTDESKQAVFIKPGDSLCLQDLGGNTNIEIPNVSSFVLVKYDKGEWLVYQAKGSKTVVIRNLATGNEQNWQNIISYWFSGDGNILVVQTEEKKDTDIVYTLKWNDLEKNSSLTIYEGAIASNLYFDKANSQIAFSVEEMVIKQKHNSIWHYSNGKEKATPLINDQSEGIDKDVKIECISVPGFSQDGTMLYLTLIEKDLPKPPAEYVQVNVWHYKDPKLQSQQFKELNKPDPFRQSSNKYLGVITITSKKFVRLSKQDELAALENRSDEYVTVFNNKVTAEEKWYPDRQPPFILSSRDGRRVFEIKSHYSSTELSPNGKFVVYYDKIENNYFSYELSSGVTRNLTQGIIVDWINRTNDNVIINAYPVAGWLSNDSSVFVYDQYDIWQLNLTKETPPLNITNIYGRKHNIIFRFASSPPLNIINANQKILLSAFNALNKQNGFYSKDLQKKNNLDSLTMGSFLYDLSWKYIGGTPLKAKNADAWILTRQCATESPNYYFTTDFRKFKQLSNIGSEREYNWLRTELHSWKAPNGKIIQGILYKPENFDKTKKYPIIFYYYEKLSHELNLFLKPEPSDGRLNIPWYVSNGYLVFEPDIHYEKGYPGKSALISVVSAAKYLSKFTFVNSKKMAIQGVSFGGFETNYIVTHSNIFTAACTASGGSNLISFYNQLISSGRSQQIKFEFGQYRIGQNLWENQNLYFVNSPILKIDKVNTPLLIMHTTNDGAVPFSQAIELFTGLRRLHKKVWMLEYTDGNHAVWGKSADDFTIRMAQFFDHFLKDRPEPVWMAKGIPAKVKGIEVGLEFEIGK
jgi:dipeptidyl aminopeptidase/acylaminoacyl peptidase